LRPWLKAPLLKTKGILIYKLRFALFGWPHTKCRLPLLKEHFLSPHIIFVFDETKEKALEKFMGLDAGNEDIFAGIFSK
jgi:hypothetical protein